MAWVISYLGAKHDLLFVGSWFVWCSLWRAPAREHDHSLSSWPSRWHSVLRAAGVAGLLASDLTLTSEGRVTIRMPSPTPGQSTPAYVDAVVSHHYAPACLMLSDGLQRAIAQDATRPGPLEAKSCGAGLPALFRTEASRGREVVSVREARVRASDAYGLVRINAAPSEDHEIPLRLRAGGWKLAAASAVPVFIAALRF
jgi:hypothetical protein